MRLDHLSGLVVDLGVRLQRGRGAADQLAVVVRRAPATSATLILFCGAPRAITSPSTMSRSKGRSPPFDAMSRSLAYAPLRPHGVAADEGPARGERPGADRRRIRVRVVHRHPVVGHTEGVGQSACAPSSTPGRCRRCPRDVHAPVRFELDQAWLGSPFWFMPVGYSIVANPRPWCFAIRLLSSGSAGQPGAAASRLRGSGSSAVARRKLDPDARRPRAAGAVDGS